MSHQQISFLKSGIRILGYIGIIHVSVFAALVLIVSELLGIVEEVGPWQTPQG
jgi:hypothetical protein